MNQAETKQAAHTRGPWEAFMGTDGRWRVTPERFQKPSVICEMIRIESQSEYPTEKVLANTRLIAAAPKLWDIVAALAKRLCEFDDINLPLGDCAHHKYEPGDMCIVCAARAALSLASPAEGGK